jgi:hypothetical protein
MKWFVRTGAWVDYIKDHYRDGPQKQMTMDWYTPGAPGAFDQHHPGDEWPNVGWVQTDKIYPYREHSGDQTDSSPEKIKHLTEEFQNGAGFVDPLRLYYNPDTNRAYLGEGNHRLQAGIRAGLTHMPVTVHTFRDFSDTPQGVPAQFERKLFQQKDDRGFTRNYDDQIHPGNVLPADWLHPADLIPKLQEQGVSEDRWPQNVRDWHNRPKPGGAPLISESSISEGSVRPFFVRQADAGRPKYDQPSAQDRANKAWGMDGKDEILNMPFYSPMTDMTDEEVAAEFGYGNDSDKFDRQSAKPLVSPQTWGGPGKLQDMDPQTLEAYRKWQSDVNDYVGRFIKQHPASPKNVIEHFQNATPEEVQEGMDWYQKANLVAKSIANNSGISVPQAAGLLAVYSPQTDWYNNMMRASRVAQLGKGIGGKGSGIMASDAQKQAADRILSGEDYHNVVKGPKIRSFADLIATGGDPDPDNPLVVVDRHAVGVTHGQFANDFIYNASGTGVRNYRNRTADYVNAARALGKKGVQISPHQLQAATWLVRQRRNVENGYVDPGRAAARIKMTDNAKKQWEGFAAKYHPDLLGDAAPIVGFENAQRIASNYSLPNRQHPYFVRHAEEMPKDPFQPTRNDHGYYDDHFSIIHKPSGAEIYPGSKIKDFRGDEHTYNGLSRIPEYGGSGGKIVVDDTTGYSGREFYPSVFDIDIVPRVPSSEPRQQLMSSRQPYFVRREA